MPPCVLRSIEGEWGSLSLGVTGVPSTNQPFITALGQVDAAAFFDCLVGQQDRHRANYRWDSGSDHLWLIDHGFCFARPGDPMNTSDFLSFRSLFRDMMLTEAERDCLVAFKASANLHGVSDIIEPARAAALAERANRMLASQALLPAGDF